MPRKLTGIRRRRGSWEVYVNVHRRRYTRTCPPLTPFQEMKDWRAAQLGKYGSTHATAGTFGADIQTYLGRVAAMPSYKQRAAHLELWARALGRDRPRQT